MIFLCTLFHSSEERNVIEYFELNKKPELILDVFASFHYVFCSFEINV